MARSRRPASGESGPGGGRPANAREGREERIGEEGDGRATDLGLLALVVIWGVNFSVIKAALGEIPPLAFNAVRFPLASAVLWVILRRRGRIEPIPRDELPRLLFLGILGHVVYQLLFIYGMDATRAGNASVLLATVPVWTALLSTLRGHERPGLSVWIGAGATVAGVGLLVVGGAERLALGGGNLQGDLLMVAASLGWAAYTVEGRDLIRRHGALRVTAWTLWIGTGFLVLLGLPALLELPVGEVSPAAWAGAGYAGVFAVGVAYLLWYWGVGRLGSTRAAAYGNAVPVVALFVAWLWLGEEPAPLELAGAAVIIAGASLARVRGKAPEAASGVG